MYVCVRVPIQILRLLIHAIEQYVVKPEPKPEAGAMQITHKLFSFLEQ